MQTTTPAAQATTARHTPGPWIWDDNTLRPANPDPDTSSVHSILDADGGYGFLLSDVRATCAELDADRTLIAAAPELLEALQRLLSWEIARLPVRSEDIAFARAAIAKATGQQGGAA